MSVQVSDIGSQILNELKGFELTFEDISDPVLHKRFLRRFLTSKRVKQVPQDEKENIFNEAKALLPSYLEFYNKLKKSDTCTGNYTKLEDAHNISEYFTSTGRYKVIPDYLKFIKSSKKGYLVNVYGDEFNRKERGGFFKGSEENKRRHRFTEGRAPRYELFTPEEIKYSVLMKPVYKYNALIENCLHPVPVLAVNLPYTYYSMQNVPANIFTWDLDKEKYQIGGKDLDVINPLIKEIATRGFQKPLVMRISGGRLSAVDNDTLIQLFLATYLNLPTIPVALYMSYEDSVRNYVIEEMQQVVHARKSNSPGELAGELERINKICKPFFIFEEAEGNEVRAYLSCGWEHFAKQKYPSVNDIKDPNAVVLDRYLDPNVEAVDPVPGMTDQECQTMIDDTHEKMRKELEEKLKKENEEVLKNILAGKYS